MARALQGLRGRKVKICLRKVTMRVPPSWRGTITPRPSIYLYINTHKLTFLDVCNYLPFGYAKYLSIYRGPTCEGGKSFPYKYVDNLDRLHDPLPPNESFYSSLHSDNMLEDRQGPAQGHGNYAKLSQLWACEGMALLCDLIVYYNSCDVVHFLVALQRQCDIFKASELEMLKDGLPLPSIGLHYSIHGSKCLFYMFGPTHTHLAELMSSAIMDGLSIVFKRHAKAGATTIQMSVYVYVLFQRRFSHVQPNPCPTGQAEQQRDHEQALQLLKKACRGPRPVPPPSRRPPMASRHFPVMSWSGIMPVVYTHGVWCRTSPSVPTTSRMCPAIHGPKGLPSKCWL